MASGFGHLARTIEDAERFSDALNEQSEYLARSLRAARAQLGELEQASEASGTQTSDEPTLPDEELKAQADDENPQSFEIRRESLSIKHFRRPSTGSEARRLHLSGEGLHDYRHYMSEFSSRYMEQYAGLRRLAARVAWLKTVEEPIRSGMLHSFIDSKVFSCFLTSVIVLNAVTVSMGVNAEMQNLYSPEGTFEWQFVAEFLFMIFYTAEMVLKIYVHGWFFFINRDAAWNNFDMSLVLLGLYDMIIHILQTVSQVAIGGTHFGFARLGRMLKLSRLLRILRAIRFVAPLRQILNSMRASLSMLFWALLFLLLLWWILSLIFLQGMIPVVWDEPETRIIDEASRQEILERFGSISVTLVTLMSISTGGEDWEATYHLVSIAGRFYGFILLFYLAFFNISLVSVLTGIVVEHVVAMSNMDDHDRVMHFRKQKAKQGQELKRLFAKMDVDMSGLLSEEEFTLAMRNPEILAKMEDHGVEPRDAHVFFKLLKGVRGDGEQDIDAEKFIDGFVQMRGNAAAIDVQILQYQAELVLKLMRRQQHELGEVKDLLRSRPALARSASTVTAPPRLTTRSAISRLTTRSTRSTTTTASSPARRTSPRFENFRSL